MKKKLKVFLIIFILIMIPPLLIVIMAGTDYTLAKNDRDPFFARLHISYAEASVLTFERDEDDFDTDDMPIAARVFRGFGYKLVVCHFCETNIYLMPFGIGDYPREILACENNNEGLDVEYQFEDGRLVAVSKKETIDITRLSERPNLVAEINAFDEVIGCYGDIRPINEQTYVISKVCILTEMSPEDTTTVELTANANQTRTERAEFIKANNASLVCELKR